VVPASFGAEAYHSQEFDFTTQIFERPTRNSHARVTPESIHSVAVLPVDLGVAAHLVPNPHAAVVQIEKQAAEHLASAGYKVIPADEMRKIITEVTPSIGDLYDTRTGRPYPDRIRDRAELIWQTHLLKHAPDAYLLMSLVLRKAEVNNYAASWDGIKENVSGRNALVDFWTGPAQQFAAVPGLSLAVWLITPDKVLIYGGSGGLHLVAYIRQSGGHADYLEVAPSEAIVAEARVERALNVGLDPAFPKAAAANTANGRTKDSRRSSAAAASYPQAPVKGSVAPGAPPFVTASQFRSRYKKIALAPVTLPEAVRDQAVASRYEAILKHQLEAAGFEVVGSELFLKFFAREFFAGDNLYDPETGRFNQEKVISMRMHAFELERQECGCDVLMSASIFRRPALFTGPEAHWLGATQIVTGDSTSLAAKLDKGGNKVGSIPATVFHVMVVDPARVTLYEGLGGLELQSRLTGGGFTPVSSSELYVDAQRNETAVALALADLISVKQPR
jgi:hypothetical protein